MRKQGPVYFLQNLATTSQLIFRHTVTIGTIDLQASEIWKLIN